MKGKGTRGRGKGMEGQGKSKVGENGNRRKGTKENWGKGRGKKEGKVGTELK